MSPSVWPQSALQHGLRPRATGAGVHRCPFRLRCHPSPREMRMKPRPRRRRAVLGAACAALLVAGLAVTSTVTAHAASTLLSQGRPATASSTENAGTPASAAVDGNAGTRWSSAFSDPQWIQVDLGASDT